MRFPSKLLDVLTTYDSVFLRLALGVTFLAAVSDRFGMWGPPGSPNVAWGNLERRVLCGHAQPVGSGGADPGDRVDRHHRRDGLWMRADPRSRDSMVGVLERSAVAVVRARHDRWHRSEVGAQRLGLLGLRGRLRARHAARRPVDRRCSPREEMRQAWVQAKTSR